LTAKTYVYLKKLSRKKQNPKAKPIIFLDTLNYAKLSVEKLGIMLNIKKLPKPKCLGRKAKTDTELKDLIEYNLRDSEISQKGLKFLYDAFVRCGATPRLTIASTAMSLYKNKYLHASYSTQEKEDILELFKGYYGGRTEAFARGEFSNYRYYDFNSLYPSMMMNRYPNPNTFRKNRIDSTYYIENYDGMADVMIYCPYMDYPLLPLRLNNKLIFPTGKFRGYYTSVELRKALELGYKICKVYKNLYYKDNCEPFAGYVTDLYNLRLKNKDSPMGYVLKILMNSLYGKFGQKFENKDNIIPLDHTLEELQKYKTFEIINDAYVRITEDLRPSSFCIPIWASYVTAYARLKLHKYILLSHPLYVDTDSIITRKQFKNSKQLGELKLEADIEHGTIVKPKFYAILFDKQHHIKIKGIGRKIVINDFEHILAKGNISFSKFAKIRESLRRGFIPNEIIQVTKNLNLEDDKRDWGRTYDGTLQFSKPLGVDFTFPVKQSPKSLKPTGKVKSKNLLRCCIRSKGKGDAK
jgi:hypothetical protein